MARTKQTLTKAELEAIKARNKRAGTQAKRMADEATKQAKTSIPSSSKTKKTDPNAGKAPCKTLEIPQGDRNLPNREGTGRCKPFVRFTVSKKAWIY